MEMAFHCDVVSWRTQADECDLTVRTSNGWLFNCHLDPLQFVQSTEMIDEYIKYLGKLQFDGDRTDDSSRKDACHSLLLPFRSLIAELAAPKIPLPTLTASGRPTLSQYLFPQQVSCILNDEDDDNHIQPIQVQDSQEYTWRASTLTLDDDSVKDLGRWTQTFHPSKIEVCYDKPRHVLIKPPKRVMLIEPDGQSVTCFFKPFRESSGTAQANMELSAYRKMARAQRVPPHVQISKIYGLVRDGGVLLGMLFPWIDKKEVLSRRLAKQSPPDLRRRWASQIERSVETFHQHGVTWGDSKADNVLIDKNDDAWVIGLGGSYDPGWVDPEMAAILGEDEQGLWKIMEMLEMLDMDSLSV
ncbi:hypothetical protein BKA56DRAFT_585739 [Ilyonectria sp. MPI-CAGE-AT-0026]|nr:hypothetical protein BKA56DRAFT_585739 [Ilyonectria sp. MPI-CAGE-AT-0026]